MNSYQQRALQLLDHVCAATATRQAGNELTVTFPDTAGAYDAYVVVSAALGHECREVNES